MSIRETVAKQEQSKAVAQTQQQPATPAQKLKRAFEVQAKEFEMVLPKHIDAQQFARQAMSAVKTTPKLMECFMTEQGKISIMLAAMQAGVMGLMPNTPAQECWLLPRTTRKNIKGDWVYTTECELQIGYRGYLKLMRQGGEIETIYAEVVREGDEFEYERGLKEDKLRHVPSGDESSALTHAYAVVRYLNGGYQFIVLGRQAIEARRDKSESWKNEKARPYSPWSTSEAAMWRKSALRAIVPFIELSPETQSHLSTDEQSFKRDDDGDIVTDEPNWIDAQVIEHENELAVEVPQTAEVIEVEEVKPETPKEEKVTLAKSNGKSDTKPQEGSPWVEKLKAIYRDMGITGPTRWESILDVTGMQPRDWKDVTEAMAEDTARALDPGASI